MKRFVIGACCLAFVSAGLGPAAAQTPSPPNDQKIMVLAPDPQWEAARAKIARMKPDEIAKALSDALTDQTRMYKQDGHGVYLEYTSPSGELFMWYRGNRKAVHGTWKIDTAQSPPRACYKYLASRNGVTGVYEPYECVEAAQTLGDLDLMSARKGDPFKLSSGEIPYVKTADDVPAWPK